MTETEIAILETKVKTLEIWAVKHEHDDDRTHKYITHMQEDLLVRLGSIDRSAARFESDIANRVINELNTQTSLNGIFKRLRSLERLAWIAIGGLGSIGALATFFGWSILKTIAK